MDMENPSKDLRSMEVRESFDCLEYRIGEGDEWKKLHAEGVMEIIAVLAYALDAMETVTRREE